jgi:hypothetical protein
VCRQNGEIDHGIFPICLQCFAKHLEPVQSVT